MATDLIYNPLNDVPVAPGETIREILDERGIRQSDFAVRLGRSEKFVSQLVNGKASLSHETAIDLERVLGVPASFWNTSESRYRDGLARQLQRDNAAEQTKWVRSFPVKEMESHGWIAKEDTPEQQAETLLRYFGVSSIEAYGEYWGSERRLAARISTAYTAETPALAAWLRAGEIAAEQISTQSFNDRAFRDALSVLRGVSRLPVEDWAVSIAKTCAQAGVAVVFVRDLPKTRCHGVSWWATKTRAVIQLGLRYKTDDQVWFSLYHEAGHLLLDDRSRSGISDLNTDRAAEERADTFAANTLVPPKDYAAFVAAGKPTKAAVLEFADKIGIAPGIVVGRLQKDEVIPHSWMNDLKTKVYWAK